MSYKVLKCLLFLFPFLIACNTNTPEDPTDGEKEDTVVVVPPKPAEPGEYKLVWEDTFDGTTLDEAGKWSVEVNGQGGGNQEYQYYRRENLSVGIDPVSGESCLIITGKKESFSGKSFTSGRLRTAGKMSFKYGKIEGRVKIPHTANGLWPAFWMMGANYSQVGWPKCGEIDIFEMGNVNGIRNNTQDRYFGGHFHWGESYNGGAYPNTGSSKTNPYSIQGEEGDFHLFTVIWTSGSVKMYLDLDKYPDNQPYTQMSIGGNTYFNKPFYVIFNLAIGGTYTGITGNDNFSKITALNEDNNYEAKMYVDYVKVYQRGDEGEEFHNK